MRPVLFTQYNYFLLKNKKKLPGHITIIQLFLVNLIKLIYKYKVDFFFDVFTCKYVKNRIYKQFYLIEKNLKYAYWNAQLSSEDKL